MYATWHRLLLMFIVILVSIQTPVAHAGWRDWLTTPVRCALQAARFVLKLPKVPQKGWSLRSWSWWRNKSNVNTGLQGSNDSNPNTSDHKFKKVKPWFNTTLQSTSQNDNNNTLNQWRRKDDGKATSHAWASNADTRKDQNRNQENEDSSRHTKNNDFIAPKPLSKEMQWIILCVDKFLDAEWTGQQWWATSNLRCWCYEFYNAKDISGSRILEEINKASDGNLYKNYYNVACEWLKDNKDKMIYSVMENECDNSRLPNFIDIESCFDPVKSILAKIKSEDEKYLVITHIFIYMLGQALQQKSLLDQVDILKRMPQGRAFDKIRENIYTNETCRKVKNYSSVYAFFKENKNKKVSSIIDNIEIKIGADADKVSNQILYYLVTNSVAPSSGTVSPDDITINGANIENSLRIN